ncbi:MAG: hypothetical protein HYU36_23210 [Planctomycetes bacterium]|nr:hypothetical protein [Planctomycetota bacterium]
MIVVGLMNATPNMKMAPFNTPMAKLKRRSDDVDFVAGDPDVELAEAPFPFRLAVAKEPLRLPAFVHVNNKPDEAIVILGPFIQPRPDNSHGIHRYGIELLNDFFLYRRMR